jgi:hypothetical protein
VEDWLAVQRKAAGGIGHQAAPLGAADGLAQVGLLRQAEFALAAFRRVQRDDMVVAAQGGHARADVAHHARALVSQDRREDAFRIGARQGVVIGVANAGGLHLDQYLAGLRPLQFDLFDRQRLACLPCNRCLGFHAVFLSTWTMRGRCRGVCHHIKRGRIVP